MAYVAAHNIFSPLGATSAATFAAVAAGRSAVAEHPGIFPGDEPVWIARLPAGWEKTLPELAEDFSPFEKMLIASIRDAAAQVNLPLASERTVFVFATTKGNIGLLDGEAAATIILTAQPPAGVPQPVRLAGGAVSNDANHISGPSRTGAELAQAIAQALEEAGVAASEVDFISAHGTATPYNDAMEAKAFALGGVQDKPVHSVKGALGHTLGAAGVVEAVLSVLALAEDCLLPTAGYSQPMPEALDIATTARPASLRVGLKTASGFGGCNGALVFVRE
ncbi:MAG: hypothetical protein EOO56_19720 [Hymenobacter sp.]|nr:MAG: hypothetical protein EOO56_19720 [Hymenobacter sp.]